jgi:glutamate racemase
MIKPIGVIDSGVGGLTAVKQIQKILPNENVIYFGDSLRMPYGNRTYEEVVEYANKIIEFLEEKDVKAIALACNTISSQIESLKANVPLFSIVEYGCMQAAELHESEVGLIATVATVKSGVYDYTIKRMAPNVKLISNDSSRLPKVINSQMENVLLLYELIKECIDPIASQNVRTLILGCSHFPIIENEIKTMYPSIKLIDPAERQIKELKKYLIRNDLDNKKENGKYTHLYTTADMFEYVASIKRLNLKFTKLEEIKLLEND